MAPFFLKKFRGAYCDINDLPTLDPELYRYGRGAGRRRARKTKRGKERRGSKQRALQCSWAVRETGDSDALSGLGSRHAGLLHIISHRAGRARRAVSRHVQLPCPPPCPRPCSNLVFLKRYEGDVAELGLTFTITDSVLGAAHEVGAGWRCGGPRRGKPMYGWGGSGRMVEAGMWYMHGRTERGRTCPPANAWNGCAVGGQKPPGLAVLHCNARSCLYVGWVGEWGGCNCPRTFSARPPTAWPMPNL